MLTVRTVRIVWQAVDAPALDDPGIFPASYIERIAGTNINESLHQSASRAWLYEHASHARLERLVEEWNAREREQKLLLALRLEELQRRQHGAGREDA